MTFLIIFLFIPHSLLFPEPLFKLLSTFVNSQLIIYLDLYSADCSVVFNSNDVNESYNPCFNIFNSLYDKNVPLVKLKHCNRTSQPRLPWVTSALLNPLITKISSITNFSVPPLKIIALIIFAIEILSPPFYVLLKGYTIPINLKKKRITLRILGKLLTVF